MERENTTAMSAAALTRLRLVSRLEEESNPEHIWAYRDILQAWLRCRSLKEDLRVRIERLLELEAIQ